MTFTREHFVSAPDEVFVSRLTADKPGAFSFRSRSTGPNGSQTQATQAGELLMTGTLNDGRGGKGVTYAARLRVLPRGGSVTADGSKLVVKNADEVILLLAAATDFRGFAGRQLSDPVAATQSDLDQAAKKSIDELREAQQARPPEVVRPRGTQLARDSQQRAADQRNDWPVLPTARPIPPWRHCISTSADTC